MPVSLFRRQTAPAVAGRVGIIDIGSNSVRLVVYEGPARIPAVLFNEKVMAGLGKGLAKTGEIDADAADRAVAALARFRGLARAMDVRDLRTVATAAVRDAANGPAFVARLRALGLDPQLLSGEEEAAMAGYGVLAGIPGADGVAGDLGGGSLELIRVADGTIHQRLSLPLGVLRLGAVRAAGPHALERRIDEALARAGWGEAGADRPFYLVGGSWRALARLDMHLTGWPLPIMHHYRMPAAEAQRLVRTLAQIDRKRFRDAGVAPGRAASLPDAAALLALLVRRLRSSGLVVSAFGLREGLLHRSLPPAVQAEDPLLAGMRDEGARQGRFAEHGDLLAGWLAPLFADEDGEDARLRHAACLLADVGWRAHPEFRAVRGLETALHGNWVGIDARGRAMVARALWTHFGGEGATPALDRLAAPADLVRADRWGLAMRLGQRLSGGTADALAHARLTCDGETVTLALTGDETTLYGEAVERRLKALAAALGRRGAVVRG